MGRAHTDSHQYTMKPATARNLALMLILSMPIAGCGKKTHDQPSLKAIPIADKDWQLLDGSGKAIPKSAGTFTLADAEVFRCRNTDFGTPRSQFKKDQFTWERNTLVAGAWRNNKTKIGCVSTSNLLSGDIFITGGEYMRGNHLSSKLTWLINPQTGSIRQGPNLHFGRSQHNMLRLRDGRILISGGYDFTILLKSVEIFDPATNTISYVGDMSLPRTGHGVIELTNGNILIAGGQTDKPLANAPGDLTDKVEILNLKNKTFSLVGRIITPRRDFIIVPFKKNQIIIAGGMNVDWIGLGDARWVRDAELLSLKD